MSEVFPVNPFHNLAQEPVLLVSGDWNVLKNEPKKYENGVYMCSGINFVSSFKQPIYVGSSVDLRDRIIYTHIPSLNNQTHVNPALQNGWNKHGQDNFVWWLLEGCPKELTLEREQYYLDLYRPFADEMRGYNIAKDAKAPMKGRSPSAETREKMRVIITGTKRTPEVKRKMSEALKNRPKSFWDKVKESNKERLANQKGTKLSEEHKKNISRGLMGKEVTEETRQKIRDTMTGRKYSKERADKISLEYKLINPEGIIFEGRNISELCRIYNLSNSKISLVLNNKRNHHKGWKKVK